MKGTAYIEVAKDLHLEVHYTHQPMVVSIDYDVPDDPAWTEVNKVVLCGWVEISKGHSVQVSLDITDSADDLQAALDWTKIEEAADKDATEQ